MIKAKLFVSGTERELLWTDLDYYRIVNHKTGRCGEIPMGGLVTLAFASGYDDDRLLRWMTHSPEGEFCTLTACKIVFYEGDFDGIALFEYKYNDATLVYWKETFSSVGEEPMTITMTISAAIQQVKWQILIKPWQESWIPPSEKIPYQAVVNNAPEILTVDWVDENEEVISEIGYQKEAAIKIKLQNSNGGQVTVKITKNDGSEFEKGKKELTFSKQAKDGTMLFSKFEIKNKWEEFKNVEIDELVAEVTYSNQQKQSTTAMQIIPKPKATLHIRPHSGWSGEFGFDWMRIEDTNIDGDVDYEQNVGEYGAVYATQPGAVFTPKDYAALENEYDPTNINNKKDAAGNPIQYYTPWLTIYRKPNIATPPYAELELLTEVDVQPDELYIEFPKKHFDITGAIDDPNDATLKHYKLASTMKGVTTAGNLNKTTIQLKCINTLSKDETIKVWAAKKKANGTLDTPILSGQLKVRANNKINRRVSKIVFVNVKTNINGARIPVSGISPANTVAQEDYLTPFLKQALIKPDVENEDLNLFDVALPEVQTLNTDYTLPNGGNRIFHKYSNSGGISLVNFLTQQFNVQPAFAKYVNYYKVFFLGEPGGRMNGSNIVGLGGHANGIPSKECVMYSNPMVFFVAHELMHCMGLYHSFDNNGTHTFKIGQTENIMDYSHISTYATPNRTLSQISTWKWQWDILKNSNENET